jgi:hypothetical protein
MKELPIEIQRARPLDLSAVQQNVATPPVSLCALRVEEWLAAKLAK